MTNEERDIITRFVQRISGAAPSGGSVPGAVPALPAVDREADQLIGDLFTRYPDARYRLTQTAFVQEVALGEAQRRIQQLQTELEQARQAPPAPSPWTQPQPQQAPQQSRGLFGSLFGGGSSQPPPQQQYAPQPQYAPPPQPQAAYPSGYQPGMFQRSGGSGFLGSALTTAAGVAGGLVVGNALMDMFSGHHGMEGGMGGGMGGGSENVTNNFFGAPDQGALPGGDPWGGAGQSDRNFASAPDPFGQAAPDDGGGWDAGGGSDAGSGGWDDSSGGGFDDNI